ncbi:MAG: hypothetical protein ACLFO2_05570 [Candidatus Woesearchaeota archaeon]
MESPGREGVKGLILVEDLLRGGRFPLEFDRIAVTIPVVRLKDYFSEILR